MRLILSFLLAVIVCSVYAHDGYCKEFVTK